VLTPTTNLLIVHIETDRLVRIVVGVAMNGEIKACMFVGKRAYIEDKPWRYMRLLEKFAV